MPDDESDPEAKAAMASPGETRVPIIEEQASVTKREVGLEHVTVRTVADEREVVVREAVRRETVEVARVAIDREVAEAPPIRTEGDVTIVPVVEERLVMEKRLFLVEEVHVRRLDGVERIERPVTLRRQRVLVDRLESTGETPEEA